MVCVLRDWPHDILTLSVGVRMAAAQRCVLQAVYRGEEASRGYHAAYA